MTIVGIFSENPLSHEAVKNALKGRVTQILEGTFEANLRNALALDEESVVSVTNLWIHKERGANDAQR